VRRVIYSVAASLDGYIAGPDGDFDWIPMDPDIDWDAFISRFDTMLSGRKTYELMASGQSGASLPELETFVFSRTLDQADHPSVTIVSENAASTVQQLREAEGKDIWLMGGGILFSSLLEAELVDAIEIGLIPIVLGEGLQLLAPTRCRAQLTLTDTKAYPSGIVLLSYNVVRDADI
jgi:dihydrofolate reductase